MGENMECLIMLSQFKNYVEKAVMPICISAGVGTLAGISGGVSTMIASVYQTGGLQSCGQSDLNSTLAAEAVGGVTGLMVGFALGAAFPASQMLFDWCSDRRQRAISQFQNGREIVQDIELGSVVRP